MAVTLEDIAARLDRIEATLKTQPAPIKSDVRLTYKPEELAQKLGRSYRWVLDRCRAGTIPTTTRRPPYLIPASAAEEIFSKGVFYG
jgi:hypothetical protein